VTPGREQDDSGHGRRQPLAVVERGVDLLGLTTFLVLLLAHDGPLNALGLVEAMVLCYSLSLSPLAAVPTCVT